MTLYISGKDFAKLEVEKPSYVVEGFVLKHGSSMFIGDDKTSKSMLALDLAINVATGEVFHGSYPTEKGRVCYIDEENGFIEMQDRYLKMLKYRNLEYADIDFMIFNNIKLDDGKWQNKIKEYIKERKPSLIICDSAVRFMVGNEDKSQDVRKIFDFMKPLLKDTTFLFLHHSPHGVKRARGSADWGAQVSISFILGRRKGKNNFCIKQKNGRRDGWITNIDYQVVDNNEGLRIEVEDSIKVEDVDFGLSKWAKEILNFKTNKNIEGQFKRKELFEYLNKKGSNDSANEKALLEVQDNGDLLKIKQGYYIFKG